MRALTALLLRLLLPRRQRPRVTGTLQYICSHDVSHSLNSSSTAGSSAGPKTKGKGKAAPKRKASDDSDDDEEGTPLTKRVKEAAPGPEELKIKVEGSDAEA